MRRLAVWVLALTVWPVLASAQTNPPQSHTTGASWEQAFSTTTAQALVTTDAMDYRCVSVHIVSQGGSSIVNFQTSNDSANWLATTLVNPAAAGQTVPVSSSSTASLMYYGKVPGRYFRLNVTGIVSGTTAGVMTLFANCTPEFSTGGLSVSSVVTGTGATALGKAEDAGHTTADTGVFVLGVRKDTATQTTSADADYAQFSLDAYGAQFVRGDHPNAFKCAVVNSTATALTALGGSCATPGAGLSLYIKHISASSTVISTTTTDQYLQIKSGTGGSCGSATAVEWAAYNLAFAPVEADFSIPIKITANSELCWMHAAAGNKNFVVTGFIAP